MTRWEGKKIFVRYDGTETRVDIHRGEENKGLTIRELEKLVTVLTDALVERRAFEKSARHAKLGQLE